MDIYNKDFEISIKDDNSPVTVADKNAEKLILKDLNNKFPEIPIISEEAYSNGEVPNFSDEFFLVDPLDGTKEFIKKNGEFTVNIGLIKSELASIGVVYAPAKKRMFFCDDMSNAYELEINNDFSGSLENAKKINTNSSDLKNITAIISRSHNNIETDDFLKNLSIKETILLGSSYKFCLIASGKADIYPRFSPTCEWDIAAGHAILKAAGGNIYMLDGNEIRYGFKERKFINPSFLARNY
jgi:3'(2'), 5'-bisphosphate nucleotidase